MQTRLVSSKSVVEEFAATRTLNYENGIKATPLFSSQEYDRRLSNLRAKMEERELKVAIFTSMHNIGYFSNFFYCAFGRAYAQVVTQEKNVTISAMVDAGQPWRTTIGDNLVYTDWKRDNFETALKQVIGDDALSGKHVVCKNVQNNF